MSVMAQRLEVRDIAAVTPLRLALREATAAPFPAAWITESVLPATIEDVFRVAQRNGLAALDLAARRGHLPAVTGSVAEAVAGRLMDSLGFAIFAQLTQRGHVESTCCS